MSILFRCPHCGMETTVSDEFAGQSGECSTCGGSITIPDPQQGGETPEGAIVPRPRGSSSISRPLLILVTAAVLLCGLGSLLFPQMFSLGEWIAEQQRRRDCRMSLEQIGVAMAEYHIDHRCYPPAYIEDSAGNRLHSWRVLLLPYLNEDDLYKQYRFDEPWDGSNNRKLADRMPHWYGCPSDAGTLESNTNYMVVSGRGLLFEGKKPGTKKSITDNPADTILVVETVGQDVNWLEPVDLDLDKMELSINGRDISGISSHHHDGAHVVMADGTVVFLRSDEITPKALKAKLTIAGGE